MAQSDVLLECRAGKMKLVGNVLTADTRKGLLRVGRTEDSLVHVYWFQRGDGGTIATEPEADIIVFPGEASFEKVPNQRVLLLKFKDEPDRNLFFWLQEPRLDDDESRRARFNAVINSTPDLAEVAADLVAQELAPPTPTSSGSLPSSALDRAHTSNAPPAGLEMAAGPTVGQFPSAPAQGPLGTGPGVPASGAELGSALRAQPGSGSLAHILREALAAASQAHGAAQAAGPSLSELLKPEVLLPVLRDPTALERLAPYLPEEHRNPEALVALAHSPQFHQQLQTLGQALQSGQLDLAQFGLRAQGFGAGDFLAAILDLVEREKAEAQRDQPPPPGDSSGPAAMQE